MFNVLLRTKWFCNRMKLHLFFVLKWTHHRHLQKAGATGSPQTRRWKRSPPCRLLSKAVWCEESLVAPNQVKSLKTIWTDQRHFCGTATRRVASLKVVVSLSCILCVCSFVSSGTKKNLSASKILLDLWPEVESDAERHAALLLW